jgi:hypothetical protein
VKEPNSLVKAATVISSVLLLSGFVGYRAGAFNWLMGSPPPADTSNPALSPGALKPPPSAAAQTAPTLMPGSKSMVGVGEGITGLVPASPAPAPSQPPVPVVIGPETGAPPPLQPMLQTQSAPPAETAPPARIPVPTTTVSPTPPAKSATPGAVDQKPTIMYGTKSAAVFVPSDVPQSTKSQQATVVIDPEAVPPPPPQPPAPDAQPPAPPTTRTPRLVQDRPVMIPTTKSAVIFEPSDVSKAPPPVDPPFPPPGGPAPAPGTVPAGPAPNCK